MKKHNEFRRALNISLPTLVAYFPLGAVFSLVCLHQGYDWYVPVLMSLFIFGGSVQFIAVSMFSEGSGLLAILVASTFVALRNSFYGLGLINRYELFPRALRAFLIYGLVDATYAMLATHPPEAESRDSHFCGYVTLLPFLYWQGGTFFGVLASDFIPVIQGLDFILPAFFMALVIESYLKYKDKFMFILPVLVSLISYLLLGNQFLLLAMLFTVGFLWVRTGYVVRDGL